MARHTTTEIRNAVGPLQALLVATIGVPLLLFAGAAWLSHRDAYRAAWERIARIDDTVGEHAIRVFQTHELVLDRIADRTADMDWPAIRQSHELYLFLRQIREGSPQISRVGLVEPDRRIALTDEGRARLAEALPLWTRAHAELEAELAAVDPAGLRSGLDALAGRQSPT